MDYKREITGVGTGQAGGHLVSDFFSLGYPECAIINASSQDWHRINSDLTRRLNLSGTEEGGTGRSMAMGKELAQRGRQEIYDLIEQVWITPGSETRRLMIQSSMGGGAGAGSLEIIHDVVKQLCRDFERSLSKVTLVLVEPRAIDAKQAHENRDKVWHFVRVLIEKQEIGSAIVLENDVVIKRLKGVTMGNLWTKTNEAIVRGIDRFNRISQMRSDFTFDSAELDAMWSGSVFNCFGSVTITGSDEEVGAARKVHKEISTGLFNRKFKIDQSSSGAVILSGPTAKVDNLPHEYFDKVIAMINEMAKVNVSPGVERTEGEGDLELHFMFSGRGCLE